VTDQELLENFFKGTGITVVSVYEDSGQTLLARADGRLLEIDAWMHWDEAGICFTGHENLEEKQAVEEAQRVHALAAYQKARAERATRLEKQHADRLSRIKEQAPWFQEAFRDA